MIRGEQRFLVYRPFEVALALLGLVVLAPVMFGAWIAAAASTKSSGLFRQDRVGCRGNSFDILKLRTMAISAHGSTVTTTRDHRITRVGAHLRRYKLDELPQLINVIKGEMSFIGPRPDVPGFADGLTGEDRVVLSVKPGITGPATLLLANEEQLLAEFLSPEDFNSQVLFPLKTQINRAWIAEGSLLDDFRIALWTLRRPDNDRVKQLISRWDHTIRLEPQEWKNQYGTNSPLST